MNSLRNGVAVVEVLVVQPLVAARVDGRMEFLGLIGEAAAGRRTLAVLDAPLFVRVEENEHEQT